MSSNTVWDKERAESFARPVTSKGISVYAVTAGKITADWVTESGMFTFLDLGTGPGFLPIEVKRLFPGVRAVGVDPSPAMVGLARRNAESAGLTRVEVIVGRAEDIPVGTATLDLVVAQYSLHDWDDVDKGFTEVYRVLRPGGRLALIDWNRDYPRWKFYLHNMAHIRQVGWRRGKEARISYRRSCRLSEVLTWLRRHRLEPVVTEDEGRKFYIMAVKSA